MRGSLGRHLILGGDFNASFYGLTDLHHVEGSIPRHKRYLARTSITRSCGRTGPDGDEHLDGRRLRTGTVHTMQLDGTWRRPDANGLYHGNEETGSKTGASVGLRLVHDGSQGGACCSFAESETETLCETCMAKTLALRNCRDAQIDGDHRDDWYRTREGRHFEQAEPNSLCRAIWRKRRALKRENI